jgi:hypothetical protein
VLASAIVCFALEGTRAHAEEAPAAGLRPVLARALGSMPSSEVVAFVARNARSTTFDATTDPALSGATARQVIERNCGSVQEGYVHELALANKLPKVQLDAPLGTSAFSLRWPACLHARTHDEKPITYAVKSRDTLTGIRQRFTGTGAFDPNHLNTFFGLTDLGLDVSMPLKPGTRLSIPYTTESTVLYPTTSVTSFAAGLNSTAPGRIAVDDHPTPPGEIIGPVHFSVAGHTQGSFARCDSGDSTRPYPFDPVTVEQAYRVALASTQHAVSTITVVVVDNGFFGTPCTAVACPEMQGDHVKPSPRFPREFFDENQFGAQYGYGPKLSGTNIQPLNYWNKTASGHTFTAADINDETGHGTHVAGLTLGGPLLLNSRGLFFSAPATPWLTLAIANLSSGSPKLALGSDRNLAALLQPILGFKVVNMSIAFDGHADSSIAGTIAGAIGNDTQSLFVVAAGNQGGLLDDDANEFYPARLGGSAGGSSSNVITTASLDGPHNGVQRLSAFSNRSARYVDLAAPGCQLSSWIDADRPAVKISGTSQATPIVTFAASLLASMWRASAVQIKNRLLYSGTLLDGDDDRAAIRSGVQLSIDKALTYEWDRVSYTRKETATGQEEAHTYLGSISLVQGLKCDGGGAVDPRYLRAVKRLPNKKLVIYRVDSSQRLQICTGTAGPQTALTISIEKEVFKEAITDRALSSVPIQGSEIDEVVRSR